MKKRTISKIIAAAVSTAVISGTFAGCSSNSSTAELLTKKTGEDVTYESNVSTEEALSSITEFSLDFMKEAVNFSEDENPVLSPASAYLALLLLSCGSSGETARELSEVLHIPEDEWADYGSVIMNRLNRSEGETIIKTSDSVWFDNDGVYEAKQEYLDIVSRALKADVYSADLQSDSVVSEINKWVYDSTNGLIEKLRENPYEDTVKAVLLNALYFEAKWLAQFKAELTSEETFTTSDGNEIITEFLNDYECYRYYIESNGIEGIMMPYTNNTEHTENDMAFIALRSTDGKTPEDILESLSPEMLREFTDTEKLTFMNFSMPKFDINYNQDLNEIFSAIGLNRTMSEGGADLSNMFKNKESSAMNLKASQVVRIRVDEEGTEAAAVTEIAVTESALPLDDPVELHLDTPFLYMIVDTENAVPIFMGILENPAQ